MGQTGNTGEKTDQLVALAAKLRSEKGCPWDREQTLASLKPFLMEEAYELAEVMDSADAARHLDELGDLLLQIVMQAQIRQEKGEFTFADVVARLHDKVVRRHPHVFGGQRAADSAEVLRNWEVQKARERPGPRGSLLEGIPRALPALRKAQQVQERASRVGFDWSRAQEVEAKVEEELRELRAAVAEGKKEKVEEEAGDLLFAVVNLCRFLGVAAEEALGGTTGKFAARFQEMERRIRAQGRDLSQCTLTEMDAVWEAIKKESRVSSIC